MGLDNGILLKVRKGKYKLPKFLLRTEENSYSSFGELTELKTYEIAYWRKCYGLRNDILERTSCKDGKNSTLSINDIDSIIKIIFERYYTISGIRSWNTPAMYNWEYFPYRFREGFEILRNLFYIKWFMKLHPRINKHNHINYRVYFYDSY